MFASKFLLGATFATCLTTGTALAQDVVTLTFWEGHSVQEEAATVEMIEAFEASHPNIKINRVKTTFGTNFEAVTTALASNTAPDVSPIWSGFLSQFAAQGALVDLTQYGADEIASTIYPGAVDYAKWNEGIYGLPYAYDPRFLVYNEAAMKEAGITEPAKTFDDMIAQAATLAKSNGGTVERYGFGLAGSDALAYFFINLLYANGGDVFNEDGSQAAFNSEAGVKAGEIIAKLAADPGNAINVQGDTLRQGVVTGRFGMIYDGPWVFYTAKNTEGSQPVVVSPVPVVAAGDDPLNFASVGAYVVYEQSKHKEEAAEFVKFLASPEAQQYRVAALKTGVAVDVASQPAAQAAFAEVPALASAQEQLQYSRIFPKHEKWSSVFSTIIPAVEAISSGEDPQSALDGAVNQANRQLRR